jgi:uroporphyrinogen-III decarboxylase
MRTQLLESFRTKHITQNIHLPLLLHDFFEAVPEYDTLLRAQAREYVDTTPSLAERFRYFLGRDGLEFRLAYTEQIGAAFLGWCQGWAVNTTIDPSVKGETLVDGDTTTYITRTPVGEIVSKHKVSSVSHCSYGIERPIKTVDDLKVLRYVTEATSHAPNYDTAPDLLSAVGEAGLFTGGGFSCPFHELLYMFDAEDLLVMSFDMPHAVWEMIDLLHAKNIEMVEILAGSPFQVFDHETSWDVRQISPAIHNEFYVPYQKDYNDVFHAHGKLGFDHVSGQNIDAFVDGIEATGMDIIYGLHLGEENINEVVELQDRWAGRIVGVVGPDPDYLRRMTAEQVRRLCGEFISRLGDKHVIMGSSDAMVPFTPMENLQAETDALNAAR